MERQNVAFLIGLTAANGALFLSIVATVTPLWIEGMQNSTMWVNGTGIHYNKGLWEMCQDEQCDWLNRTLQPETLISTRRLFGIGTLLYIPAVFSMYVVFIMQCCRTSLNISVIVALNLFFADMFLLLASIIYGLGGRSDNIEFPSTVGTIDLSVSYYMANIAMFLGFFALVAEIIRAKFLQRLSRGYQRI